MRKGKPLAAVEDQRGRPGRVQAHAEGGAISPRRVGQRNRDAGRPEQSTSGASSTSSTCTAEAKDAKGTSATPTVELNSQPLGENVLLRLDKAIYQGGDTLNVDIRTSAGLPTVYFDIVRGGQTLLSRLVRRQERPGDVQARPAGQRRSAPSKSTPTRCCASGEIIRDSRVVYVSTAADLKIDVKADKTCTYPAATARIAFQVTDAKGKPTAAALGVIIVDEAVYALQEMQPGLEKVYFTLAGRADEAAGPGTHKPVRDDIDNLVRAAVLAAAAADCRGAAHRRQAPAAGSLAD